MSSTDDRGALATGGSSVGPAALSADRLVEVASGAALEVGAMLRDVFGTVDRVGSKRNFHDIVTEHDGRAEAVIRAQLLAAVPASTIVGEEHGLSGSGAMRWYVDPIDGTNNFASGVPFFCVSIGATLDDRLVAGVIYEPIRGELFTATPSGAWLNGAPIRATGATHDGEALLITGFPSYDPWRTAPRGRTDHERYQTMIGSFRTVRRLGSAALGLAYVAAGRADVAFGVSANPWDVAAGSLLVRSAGGRYLPIPGTPERLAAPWLVPAYIAHVSEFDLGASCMAEVALAGPGSEER